MIVANLIQVVLRFVGPNPTGPHHEILASPGDKIVGLAITANLFCGDLWLHT